MKRFRLGVTAVVMLTGLAALSGCSSTEPSAEAVACAEYAEVKAELVETYNFIGEGGPRSTLQVHVDQLSVYAEQIAAIEAPAELEGLLAEMSEIVAQSKTDAQAALNGASVDAMKATSAEMVYVEKPLLEYCELG